MSNAFFHLLIRKDYRLPRVLDNGPREIVITPSK